MTCVFSCTNIRCDTNIPWYSKNQRVLYAENLNNNKFFKMHFNWFYPFKWRCICRYIHICTGVDKWKTPCWGYKWKVRSREGVVKVVGVPGGRPKFKGKTWILRGGHDKIDWKSRRGQLQKNQYPQHVGYNFQDPLGNIRTCIL